MQKNSLSALFLVLSLTARAQTKYVFVSATGNDKNTGRLKSPFKTMERALAFSNQYEGEKVTIQLRGGTYYLDKTVVLEQADMRPSALLITPYKNEKVAISGGRRLS